MPQLSSNRIHNSPKFIDIFNRLKYLSSKKQHHDKKFIKCLNSIERLYKNDKIINKKNTFYQKGYKTPQKMTISLDNKNITLKRQLTSRQNNSKRHIFQRKYDQNHTKQIIKDQKNQSDKIIQKVCRNDEKQQENKQQIILSNKTKLTTLNPYRINKIKKYQNNPNKNENSLSITSNNKKINNFICNQFKLKQNHQKYYKQDNQNKQINQNKENRQNLLKKQNVQNIQNKQKNIQNKQKNIQRFKIEQKLVRARQKNEQTLKIIQIKRKLLQQEQKSLEQYENCIIYKQKLIKKANSNNKIHHNEQ